LPDDVTTGVRAHDMNPGLVTVSSGLVNAYFRDTKLMGTVAQVISLLSGLQVVRFVPLLTAVGEMGIDDTLLERSIEELQELDQVRLVEERSGNHRIEVRTRQASDRYRDIGQRWTQKRPTAIEGVAVDLLDHLSLAPQYEDDMRQRYDLSEQDFEVLSDVLRSCGVLDSYVSPVNGRTILHSPLYWVDNPEKFFNLAEVHGADDVTRAIRDVRDYQGMPEDRVPTPVLKAVVESGILPTTTVTSSAGPKRFIFTPVRGVSKIDKTVLDKAFALISCIRYGQHHARVTRLRWTAPELLRHLKRERRIGRHSEARAQYSPLVDLLVGRIGEDTPGRFTFHLFDTPDNLRALDIAIELSAIGETPVRTRQSEAAASKLVLAPGNFQDATRTRIGMKRAVKKSTESAAKVTAIVSGVSSDVV
jgi:hypothetical protein